VAEGRGEVLTRRAGFLIATLAMAGYACAAPKPKPTPARPKVKPPSELTGPATSRVLAIRGVTLFDGTGAAPLSNACVVAVDGRITAVGPLGKVAIPSGARVLSAPHGTTLLPGFIDMHVHSSVHPGLMPYFLANGVTSVRDLGCAESRLEELKQYRADAPTGKQLGPRLFLAGPPLDGLPRAANWFPGPAAQNAAEAETAVKALAESGVDVVKLYRRLGAPAARAAIEEAHRRGLPVTWDYQWNYRYLANAIQSGVDGLEHVFYSERASATECEQLAELIGGTGVWLDPTLVAFRPPDETVSRDPDFAQLPPTLTRFWNSLFWPMETDSEFAAMKGFVRRVHRHGGKLLAGTDSPVKYAAPGYALHHELLLLSECGLTPKEVLMAATLRAAEALRKETELGTVQPGKLADLVLVSGDPLRDLRVTRKVRWVVLNGRLHRPSDLIAQAKRTAPGVEIKLPPHLHGN
jgi:imidazolonepropionase-like amidohydrolase